MQEVRNSMGKLVCLIDKESCIVEIVMKGCKTTIQFKNDGKVEIKNAQVA